MSNDLIERLRDYCKCGQCATCLAADEIERLRRELAEAGVDKYEEFKKLRRELAEIVKMAETREEALQRELAEARKAREDAEQLMRDGWIEVADGPASRVYRKQRDETRAELAEARGLLNSAVFWVRPHNGELARVIDALLAKHEVPK